MENGMDSSRIRLLLVEDQAIDRISFERFVVSEHLPYECSFADSLEAAGAILESKEFDIVLTDHNLGDGFAFDVIEAAGPDLPTIVITGTSNAQVAVEALKMGAADYIIKDVAGNYLNALPFTVQNTLKARETKLALQKYHHELEAMVEERTRTLTATNRRLEQEIADHEATSSDLQRLSVVVEQSLNSVLVADTDRKIIYANPKFFEISGYTVEEVLGQDLSFSIADSNPLQTVEAMNRNLDNEEGWKGEIISRKKNGDDYWEQMTVSPFRINGEQISHYAAMSEDISVQREYQQKLLHQANYDLLTGLPNRLLAMDRLEQALRYGRRSQAKTAIMYMDLDGFKKVNDTMGHEFGDLLLKAVSERLSVCLRKEDTVARLGGDEFLVVVNEVPNTSEIVSIANKLLKVFKNAFSVDGKDIFAGISIGIAVAPTDSDDTGTLLRFADAAMYKAKEQGRNRYQFYTQAMNEDAEERLRIDNQLHTALERNEFEIHYQPIIDLRTNKLNGAEALLRWSNVELGRVPPDVFIPIAEENGLVAPIGEWVMREACRQVAGWSALLKTPLDIAVNVSFRQFREKGFVQFVQTVLDETQILPHQLHLEITERLLLEDLPEVDDTIAIIIAMGVRLSIDDFGTGYSSLSYLNRFSCDFLKIDRSFVNRIEHDADTVALTQAIITMGHSLNLQVVAEGVEEPEQLEYLREMGCDFVQGYLLGKPCPNEVFENSRWFTSVKNEQAGKEVRTRDRVV